MPRVNSLGIEEEQKIAPVDVAPVVVAPVVPPETEQERQQRQYDEIERDLDLLWGDN